MEKVVNRNKKLYDKSLIYSMKIIDFYKALVFDQKEFVISKRLLKSGTAVGTKIARMELNGAYKNAIETEFWLSLLSKNFGKKININEIQNNTKQMIKLIEELMIIE